MGIERKARIEMGDESLEIIQSLEFLNNQSNGYDRTFGWKNSHLGRVFVEYIKGKKIRAYGWFEKGKCLILFKEYN